jgi:thymidylate synthase ThyX
MTTEVIVPPALAAPVVNPVPKPAPSRERNIYAIVDIAPETQAYALARYSRSAASLRESVGWISNQKAADFLETFYFAYGHKSIADMAHITLALENVSVLAAVAIEDEPLWDGQERSTRYQDFTKSRYVVPGELESLPAARETFSAAADRLFTLYNALTKELYSHLADALPRPDDMDPAAYKRTLNARILDVTRTLLPYATRTSVGQITSARVLERQLARLLASPYQEIRTIALEMKEACKQPGFSPLEVRVQASLETLLARQPEAAGVLQELAGVFAPTEPAPTLVKYAEPSDQPAQAAEWLSQVAREVLAGLEPETDRTVHLVENDPPLLEAVITLLYRYSDLAYHQIQAVVRGLSPARVREIYDLAHRTRGKHDGWLREQQSGYGRIYDVLIDAKSMQDFFRHRRCVQVRQEITPRHGFVSGQEWFALGLPAQTVAAALAGGQVERYDRAMKETAGAVGSLEPQSLAAAHYLLPLGFKRRALFKMDDAQAAYMIETRSGVNGHFAYRKAAFEMWQELDRVQPEVARWVRVTPFEQSDFLNR